MDLDPAYWREGITSHGITAGREMIAKAWASWFHGPLTTARFVACLRKAGCDVPVWQSFSGIGLAEDILAIPRLDGLIRPIGAGLWETD